MDAVIKRLLDLIDASGLKDTQILKELNITNPSTITDWRNGKSKSPSAQNIVKFANYFSVSTDYILLGHEKYNTISPDETEWLHLYHNLSEHDKIECYGFIKGYLAKSRGGMVNNNE